MRFSTHLMSIAHTACLISAKLGRIDNESNKIGEERDDTRERDK